MESENQSKGKKFPCPAPFSQLYVVPRTLLDVRFCSYHDPVYLPDQKAVYRAGVPELQKVFNANERLSRRRKAYLAGDYLKGAGCSPDCYWYCKWKETGEGFSAEEFLAPDETFQLTKLWLTIGPDCNIFCRYCLDPAEFHIDYKTCDLEVMDLARDFIASGGDILLTGGEPFLPKFKLSRCLEQLIELGGQPGSFEIHTNGMFLNERNRDLILRGPVAAVDVSMDTLRKDTFEYLRKGADFDRVWGNIRALRDERDAQGLDRPRLTILCAVMTDTYDHIIETVDTVISEGFSISLNALFKAYYSPDFSSGHGLHNLDLDQLQSLHRDVLLLEEKYGTNGPFQCQGFKGQLENLLELQQSGSRGRQVVLGDGGEARRKASLRALIGQGRYRIAYREFVMRSKSRVKRIITTAD